MASSEWMELENLSRDIADSNGRLEAAKLVGSHGLAQVIQKEIAQLEERRSQLLSNIATSVVGEQGDTAKDQPAPQDNQAAIQENTAAREAPEAAVAESENAAENAEELADEAEEVGEEPAAEIDAAAEEIDEVDEPEQPPARVVSPMPSVSIAAPEPSRYDEPSPDRSAKRPAATWNQLTPGDVERAKRDLSHRRVETLARHAAELRALDADQSDIDALERAIEVFTRKFAPQSAGAEVVRLEPERSPRRQSVG